MITLTFDPGQQTPPRTGAQGLDGFMLQPGRQAISAADWGRLQAHPYFADLLEQGAVVVHELEPSFPTPLPALGEGSRSPEAVSAADLQLGVLNQMSEPTLIALPHVGKVTAARLIAARPYATLEAARTAAGLSPAKWAEVLPAIPID